MSSDLNKYLICQHPSHAALAEIFTKSQYEKALRNDPAYELIGSAPTRAAAVERIGSALVYALAGPDRDTQKVKTILKALLFGTL